MGDIPMSTQQYSERHLAMLIDGDNAQHKFIKEMLEEVSRYGTATYRHVYGDWTSGNLVGWRKIMSENAIEPIQQFSYATGKNATDSALIVEAMDILYSGTVQGFCIVSSDSDYTRLCMRIRKAGLFVMGIGRKQTPEAFVKACNVFVFVENLIQPDETVQSPIISTDTSPEEHSNLIKLLHSAFDIAVQEDGSVFLGALGDALRRIDPSFDSRTYKHKKLSSLIRSLPEHFIIEEIRKNGPSSIYYVRMIEK
jgi:uncharacterized LabA/DUF88 family protein